MLDGAKNNFEFFFTGVKPNKSLSASSSNLLEFSPKPLDLTKTQKFETSFSWHWENFLGVFDVDRHVWKGFNVIWHSTTSDDYLRYLILCDEKKKLKHTWRQKFSIVVTRISPDCASSA